MIFDPIASGLMFGRWPDGEFKWYLIPLHLDGGLAVNSNGI